MLPKKRFPAIPSPLVAALVAASALAGCERQVHTDYKLLRFADCDELRAYVADSWVEMIVQSMYGGYGVPMEDDAEAGDTSMGADDGGGAAPTSWSETNVQEQGVDESDLVKTDGEFIYVAQRGELTVLKSWPPEETARIASVDLDSEPFALFLHGDRVLVFSYSYDLAEAALDAGWAYSAGTRLTVVDVADRAAPAVTRLIDLEGWYASARLIGSDVYTVLSTYGDLPYDLWERVWSGDLGLPEIDWEASEEEREAALAEARERVRPLVDEAMAAIPDEQLVPQGIDRAAGAPGESAPLLACHDVYHPAEQSIPSVLSVVHLDLAAGDAGSEVSATGVMADGWTVYASQESLYVSQTSYSWYWGWDEDFDLTSRIHKFDLEGADSVYVASGEVPGWLLNQFAMGEHEGYLRVATTDDDWWDGGDEEGDPANNVFVLAEAGDELARVGEARGIAPGEQVYAARFLGDRGYLVTYRQIDPLFAVDLSDPTSPEVVGELEMPGYSSYLHPVGEDHLIGVGMDGTEDGQVTGMAIRLFDVSDFAAPQIQATFTLESDDWSYSDAMYDPHAFTFFDGVLTVPIYTWQYDDAGDGEGFSGLLVLDVDLEAGFTELGRIDHADIVAESECVYGGWVDGMEGEGGVVDVEEDGEETEPGSGGASTGSEGGDSGEDDPGEGGPDEPPLDDGGDEPAPGDGCEGAWYAWMRRGIVIEDALYSLSDYGLKVNELRAPEVELARVVFWPAEDEPEVE